MKKEISQTQYLLAHGRSPKGRGLWAFYFDRKEDQPWFAPGQLTYSEAKKLAQAEAKARGSRFIEVAP